MLRTWNEPVLARSIVRAIQVKRCGPTQTRQGRRVTRNPSKSGTSLQTDKLESFNFNRVARAAQPVSADARPGLQSGVRSAEPQAPAPPSRLPDAPAPGRSAPGAAA